MINIKRIHHVAYRCKDAKQTVDWYKEMLNMELTVAIAENEVPSTKEPDPYMHIFLDSGMGNVLAFFEIPNSPDMGRARVDEFRCLPVPVAAFNPLYERCHIDCRNNDQWNVGGSD